MTIPRYRVAVVLPPREGFGPGSAGAIGLLQERLGRSETNSSFDPVTLGIASSGPVFPIAFQPIHRRGLLAGAVNRYVNGILDWLGTTRVDLIEVHNRPEIALRLARRFPPRRIALILHNDPRGMRGATSPRLRAALSHSLGRILCVSPYLRDLWMEGMTGVPAPDILPNCLDLSALPAALPADQRERTLLFAGRLVADKGADTFVAACARALPALPGWQAVMIGADRFSPDSPETLFTRSLRVAARDAGVALRGFQDHAAVMTSLSRAAIAVLPSRWQEPFGLAALEAMASGCALVTTRRGGLAALAEGAAVFVDPEDPAAVANAILDLARDETARIGVAEAGLRRARDYDLAPARALLDRIRMDMLQP
jgi:UDP-glucose:(glucosyl)LPS alpha-1,2-glucosyltransferase